MINSKKKKKKKKKKRATPKWVTKSCDNRYDEVCKWNSIQDLASCLVFNPFWGYFDLDLWVIECALLCCTLVPSKKSVGEIAPEMCQLFSFNPFLWKFDLDLWSFGQGYPHLGHWMCLNGLYLDIKYAVCRWNSLRDMTSSLDLYTFWGKIWPWPWPRPWLYWVVPLYQVWRL